MLKNLVIFFIFTLSAPGAFALGVPANPHAQTQQAPVERFTADEKKFFLAIAAKAVQIVDLNKKNASQQRDCIKRYIDNGDSGCAYGRMMVEKLSTRYRQYREAYALGNQKQFNQWKTLPGAAPTVILGTPFSTNYFDFPYQDTGTPPYTESGESPGVETINQKRVTDKAEMQALAGCALTEEDMDLNYHNVVNQVIASTPVVMMIRVIDDDFFAAFRPRRFLPNHNDILAAYDRYLEALNATRKTFTTDLDMKNLEGLFMYQMLAFQVVEGNAAKWAPIFEAITKKMEPQNFIESTFGWLRNTLVSLNTLFIGCAVVGTVAAAFSWGIGAVVVAKGCTIAAAALAVINVGIDVMNYMKFQQEWLAGVQTHGNVEAMRVRILVDTLCAAFNIYALKMVATPATAMMIEEMLSGSGKYSKAVIEQMLRDFVKEQSVDTARAELFALGLGTAFRQLIEAKDLDRIVQESADKLLQYQTTGNLTIDANPDIYCTN